MELSILRHPDLVIALDIGSTYSGYAWQSREEFETNRNDINFNTNWGSGGVQLHKTKSCILIEMKQDRVQVAERSEIESQFSLNHDDIEKVRIGHEAEKVYMNLAKTKSDEIIGNYYFFKRFKLLLYSESFHDEQLVEDQLSQQLPLFDVMTLFIKALKDHCLNNLTRMDPTIKQERTLFVITVPAIWSEKAKKFMRKAAEQTGIAKRKVLLALEPEAAAICCMHLPKQQRQGMNNFDGKGQKFLVADLGGGTADLSAVEVGRSGTLDELCEPLGSRIGGQSINEAFLQVCHDNFEGDQWKKIFAETTPVDMLRMEADFEQKKVTIGTNDSDVVMMDIAIPDVVKKGIENEDIKMKPGATIQYDAPDFQFNATFVRENLFMTTCKAIYANTIKQVLDKPEAHGISTVILVGGFSESPIVVDSIRRMITNDFKAVQVVVPNSPFKAILLGAVLYGHDPMIFSCRVSRQTYGVNCNVLFDETKHDQSKKWKNEEIGEFRCRDIFDIHVRRRQSVRLFDQQPARIYTPMYKDQTSVNFDIYASTSLNPKYTTDEGSQHIGKICVQMPDTTGGRSRTIEVSMKYGGTELSVVAKDTTTGKEFETDIYITTLK